MPVGKTNACRMNEAERSIWRTPGTNCCCTSCIACPAHGSGHLVQRRRGSHGDQVPECCGELLDPLVELQVGGLVHMVGRDTGAGRGHGCSRHEQVRVGVVGQHHRDRAFDVGQAGIHQRPTGTCRVADMTVHQQDQRIDALVGHHGAQPGAHVAVHADAVWSLRDRQCRGHGEFRCSRCSGILRLSAAPPGIFVSQSGILAAVSFSESAQSR